MRKTEMRERPIIFSSEMVRAILAGAKTATRRVIKPQPELIPRASASGNAFESDQYMWKGEQISWEKLVTKCRYGYRPGDRLFVKETLTFDEQNRIIYAADQEPVSEEVFEKLVKRQKLMYKTCASLFMPRVAARITLELTDIARVERVQDIAVSPEDMLAEGITAVTEASEHLAFEFRELWNSINAKRGFGWESNPWVFVVKFKLLKGV